VVVEIWSPEKIIGIEILGVDGGDDDDDGRFDEEAFI